MRTPGSAEQLERVRLIAVKMFERDVPSKQIAADLSVHVQSVRAWRRTWKVQGADGLLHKPHPGRPCLLSDDQKRQLVEMLQQEPTALGYDRHFWTTAMIADLIEKRFNVAYHPDWVGEMLHGLGLSWQKPMRRARERDEAKIEAWRGEVWPELLKKTPPRTG